MYPSDGDICRAVDGWIEGRRWFAGKTEPIESLEVASRSRLIDDWLSLDHVVLAVGQPSGTSYYQLLIGSADQLPGELSYARIDESNLIDAVVEPGLMGRMLGLLSESQQFGSIGFASFTADLRTDLTARPLLVEQSNSSVVYGDSYILKLYRRLTPGTNPEFELTRRLAELGSTSVIGPLAVASGEVAGVDTTLALLQPFLVSATEGWAMATASVRDLLSERDLYADEVGGDFATESYRLGAATATVHQQLAQAFGTGILGVDELADRIAGWTAEAESVAAEEPALESYLPQIRHIYSRLHGRVFPVQRIHGDFHLQQVLRTESGWVLIDFEGEPQAPLAERIRPDTTDRDVAGMLRSFDYVSRHPLMHAPPDLQLEYRASEWAERNREAFCHGYATVGDDPLADPELLAALELVKAVYEVRYEARHRPGWLTIPLGSIERLVGMS